MTTALAAQGGSVTAQAQAVATMYQTLLTQAGLLGYVDTFFLFAILGVACLVLTLLLKSKKTSSAPAPAH